MPAKPSTEEVQKQGRFVDLELVSDRYINSKTHLRWRCSKGHETSKTYNDVQQGSGCGHCNSRKPLTLDSVRERAAARGYVLASNTYTNNHTVMEWICPKSHHTNMTCHNLFSGTDCAVCCGNEKLSIDDVRARGLVRGFVLLDSTYSGNKRALKWTCPNGHSVSARFNNIDQGSGCHICYRQAPQRFDKSQLELYRFVQNVFPDAAYNQTGLLANPRFELDVYIPSLKKAIELDGEYWHSLPLSAERDKRKNLQCVQARIGLLRLGYLDWCKKNNLGKNKVLDFLKDT